MHLFAIREADRSAGGVGGKLADQVSRDGLLLAIEQEPFEFANVLECAATGDDAGGIYRQPVMEGERLAGKTNAKVRASTPSA